MLGLRHVLGPARAVSPDRVALASVVALAAAAAPTAATAIPQAAQFVNDNGAVLVASAISTAALSLLVARRALGAPSTLAARLWLVLGGAAAGVVNTLLVFTAACAADPANARVLPGAVILAFLFVGTFFGFLFGAAFAPVVVAAVRARLSPSHEGVDRVLFTGGATLICFAIARVLVPAPMAGAAAARLAGAIGLAALAASSARILLRARFLARVRDGREIGVHVIPRSDHEDEAALIPLQPAIDPPSGVLTATGASGPYRGARGVFKLALVPLPGEPDARLLASLFWSITVTFSDTILTLILGGLGYLVSSLVVLVIAMR